MTDSLPDRADNIGSKRQETLADIYAEIPAVPCKRKCFASCGPIAQSVDPGLPGIPPMMAPAEARRAFLVQPIPHEDPLTCWFLDAAAKLCRVHAMRPIVCRAYGAVDDPRMRCPHGCVPERWLTDDEFMDLVRRADALP